MSTLVIGHRGASSTHPENTIDAFVACRDLGADGIELDVRRSADDVLVVVHDAVLPDGRTVRATPADELPPSIPLLADVFEAAGSMFVNVEIKNDPSDPDYDAEFGISVAVAGLIAAYGMHDRVIVSSFDFTTILRLKAADPTIPIGWLTYGEAEPRRLIERAESHGAAAIHPHHLQVDEAFVERAAAANLAVYTWTVDDPDRIRSLAALGVDGVITNDPRGALRALGR